MGTIAICNRKGGVTKSTTALNLGAALCDLGHAVRLVDLDGGALMEYWGALLEAQFTDNARAAFEGITLLDCPPAKTDSEVIEIFKSADCALIPTMPSRMSCNQALDLAALALGQGVPCHVLLVRYRPREWAQRNEADMRAELKKLARKYKTPAALCEARVPHSELFEQAEDNITTIFDQSPRSGGARAYKQLAKEVITWL